MSIEWSQRDLAVAIMFRHCVEAPEWTTAWQDFFNALHPIPALDASVEEYEATLDGIMHDHAICHAVARMMIEEDFHHGI